MRRMFKMMTNRCRIRTTKKGLTPRLWMIQEQATQKKTAAACEERSIDGAALQKETSSHGRRNLKQI
jgi:hypothetical protein